MKKMDEMERNIQLRSESLGYKAVLLALCAWTLWNSGQAWLIQGLTSPGRRFCWDLRYAFRDFHRLRSNIG